MVRTGSVVSSLLVAGLVATAAAAQTAPPREPDRRDLRHHIFIMEGALQRAVTFGAQKLNREIKTVSPELVVLSGQAQARGLYLEGYGVFFDVGVPILRQSMVWSFQQMLAQQDDRRLRQTVASLSRLLTSERDPARRAELQSLLSGLEAQLRPQTPSTLGQAGVQPVGQGQLGAAMMPPETADRTAPPAPSAAAPPAPAAADSIDRMYLKDPNRAYTESVQQALVDAMIDYSAPMLLGPDEWLTVAARDNEPRDSFAPQDPYEEVVTVILRIKGADLAEYRAGRIDRAETKRRVQIREF